MSHEVESGGTVREQAWHFLGHHSEEPIHSMDEAIRLFGMDWTVSLEPIYIDSKDGPKEVESNKAVVRNTDGSVLGIVGNVFEPLQNHDAFGWFQPFVDSGEWELRSGFSLRQGKIVAITAYYVGQDFEALPGDTIKRHLVLTHGHDGSCPVTVSQHIERVVCMNTWRRWMNSGSPRIAFKHTQSAKGNLERLQKWLLEQEKFNGQEIDAYRRMATKRLTRDEFRAFVKLVLGVKADIAETADTSDDAKMPRAYSAIDEAYAMAPGADVAGATLWGAVNAVTYWTSHIRGRSQGTRLESNLFGQGADVNDKAMDVAYAML